MKNYDLVIIGNGYDLHYELPTKFYNFYLSFKNAEKGRKKYFEIYKQNDERLIKNYYETIKKIRKSNFFFQYFINYNSVFDEWNQFEDHLKKIIKEFIEILNNIKANSSKGYRIIDNREFFSIRMTTTIFNYVTKCSIFEIFVDYITPERIRYISFNYYKANLENTDAVNKINKIVDLFPEMLYRDLQEFSDFFSIYLKTFVKLPKPKQINLDVGAMKIISYNYTNTAEKLFNTHTNYIHGNLNDKNKIVIGIDDDGTLGKFDIFTKNILRVNCENNSLVGTPVESVAIIGHSINELDFDTLKYILKPRINYYTIDVYYYEKDDLSKIRLARNLKNLFENDIFVQLQNAGIIKYIPY